jgi:MoxR-like ATPase
VHDTNLPQAAIRTLGDWIEGRLIGRSALVERLLIGLLTGGHVLVEGVPGLAKTRAVRLLADGVEAGFARVQCTPDLMPSTISSTGTP